LLALSQPLSFGGRTPKLIVVFDHKPAGHHQAIAEVNLMKTVAQDNEAYGQLSRLLEPLTLAMLTSVDVDGALVSRPMVPLELDADGSLWFFTDKRSAKIDQLSSVNLSFVEAARGVYLSLSGHAQIFGNHERSEPRWAMFTRPWSQEEPDSPHLALMKFVPTAGDCWDAAQNRMVRFLAVTAETSDGEAPVAGEPMTSSPATKSPRIDS
jgi:general stress protein 26